MYTTPIRSVERLRQPVAGDAWARFVRFHMPLLYYWASRPGCQDSEAADHVQEVFVALPEKPPKFIHDDHCSFRGGLQTVALNKWRDGQRAPVARVRPVRQGSLAEVIVPDPAVAFEEAEYQDFFMARALRKTQPD
jgi:DNA-directed RNA polymerase specialized sigma24 family protein